MTTAGTYGSLRAPIGDRSIKYWLIAPAVFILLLIGLFL